MTSHRTLSVREFAAALEAAGVITDIDTITRVIIDVDPAKSVEIHIQRIGDERLLDIVPMLAGAQVIEQPKAVRYWVQVVDDLISGDHAFTWPAGLRPVRPDESAPPPDTNSRWWLFEDDDAPPELAGKKVELTFSRTDRGPAKIIERRVV